MKELYLKFKTKHPSLAEILRFLVVGGISTALEYLLAGVVLYLFDPTLYHMLWDILRADGASITAKYVSQGVGYTLSTVASYFLSVLFVFEEKGESKTALGFTAYFVLSVVGLLIGELGMVLFVGKLSWNFWLTKILLTLITLTYSYFFKKYLIFKSWKKQS